MAASILLGTLGTVFILLWLFAGFMALGAAGMASRSTTAWENWRGFIITSPALLIGGLCWWTAVSP